MNDSRIKIFNRITFVTHLVFTCIVSHKAHCDVIIIVRTRRRSSTHFVSMFTWWWMDDDDKSVCREAVLFVNDSCGELNKREALIKLS